MASVSSADIGSWDASTSTSTWDGRYRYRHFAGPSRCDARSRRRTPRRRRGVHPGPDPALSARDGVRGESAASAMLSAILDQDAALQGFAATENVAFTAKYSADTRAFQAAELVATQSATNASEVGPLTRAIYDAQLWEQSAEAAQLSIVSSGPSTSGVGRTADLVAFRAEIEATQRAFAAAGTGYWWRRDRRVRRDRALLDPDWVRRVQDACPPHRGSPAPHERGARVCGPTGRVR